MKQIKYHKEVLLFLDELFDILIEKGYFSFYESSAKYLDDMVTFIEGNLEIIPHKKAPDYFSKFGNNLFYISYERNNQTTWYIFFEKISNYYYIRHITNNHVAGKYFL